jgi:hypothetical protein
MSTVVTKENVKACREQVERCGKNKENVVFFEIACFYSNIGAVQMSMTKHDHNCVATLFLVGSI